MTMTGLWFPCVFILCVLITGGHSQEMINGVLECYAGAVRCDEGYLYTKNDTSFHCGQSEFGDCRRYLWTGDQANGRVNVSEGFPLVRSARAGWAVCVSAVPVHYTRASIDFYDDNDRTILSHFDIRMRTNHGDRFHDSVVINEAENFEQVWGYEATYHPRPYPFAVGQEFTVKIVASYDNTLTYFANGEVIATRRLKRSLSEMTKVVVKGDVRITQVNVWCQ